MPNFATPSQRRVTRWLCNHLNLFLTLAVSASGVQQLRAGEVSQREANHGAIANSTPVVKKEPTIFLTPADLQRAREAVRNYPEFKKLAEDLRDLTIKGNTSSFPSLERAWWNEARSKPWAQTYPEIFHHTFIVPAKWADLARSCARAHWLFPTDGLAEKARGILLTLSDYTFEFEHFDVGMNYTIWVLQAMEAYELLQAAFTAAERGRLDAFFQRALAAVKRNDDYWVAKEPGGKLNNHYAWHKLCFIATGLLYGQTTLVEEALHGPKGIEFMLRHGFKDDGLWLEGSIPYQFAATAALLQAAELLENARYPVSLHRFTTADGRTLKQSYDALIPLLFPNCRLPAIGDCYARCPHLAESGDWEVLFRRYGSPAHAWLIKDLPARKPQTLFQGMPDLGSAGRPAQHSKLWPEMGYVALRSNEGTNYWNGQGWSAFATYSSRPVHENADKISLMLFGNGHLWLPDRETKPSAEHAFSAKVQSGLNRATLCHNTVVVDDYSQAFPGRSLQLLECHFLPEVKRTTLGDLDGQLYKNVRQLRTVLVRPEYVLDFFQVNSGTPHRYSWILHVDGQPSQRSVSGLQNASLPSEPPWTYLRNPRTAGMQQSYWEVFGYEGKPFRCDASASVASEILHCDFPLDEQAAGPVGPVRMLRLRQANAWFLAVYRMADENASPVQAAVRLAELGTWEISVHLAGERRIHTIPDLSSCR